MCFSDFLLSCTEIIYIYEDAPSDEKEDVSDNSSSDINDDFHVINLEESANCYIISKEGAYSFKTVKGNSVESVGDVSVAEVLWESFGTTQQPSTGDLIKQVSYDDGCVVFQTASPFKEGNAVIAAKDKDGNILWSWHIWLTDQPDEQVYNNNAGLVMDRNLGALSAQKGDDGVAGLLYQWGRKDPFLGLAVVEDNVIAASTIVWPSPITSDWSTGTNDYAISHPTTFILKNENNYDWLYKSTNITDNTRWATSDTEKSVYDPCPNGWRIPNGGETGLWMSAIGSPGYGVAGGRLDEGINFSGYFGEDDLIWYPCSGYINESDGRVIAGGSGARYWSATPSGRLGSCNLFFGEGTIISYSGYTWKACGAAVRCVKDITSIPDVPSDDQKPDDDGDAVLFEDSANCYMISETGKYSFKATKGNSSEPVGEISKVNVLWESFGTDEIPNVGDLIKSVTYNNGKIILHIAEPFREGNAVIAAEDSIGRILWSWHIWLTDEPGKCVYANNAGTMMDRNLGATSATPGDAGALGLLYQWGRKDPFLGSSSISDEVEAKSTISWPSSVSSSSSCGTISYATEHPTTFIRYNNSNNDWYYPGSSSTDNTRWQSEKTIYDPCPAGWRVPDGGSNGVWEKAGFPYGANAHTYDSSDEGMLFGSGISSPATWYPAAGCRNFFDGSLDDVGYYGYYGYYWSVTPDSNLAYGLYFFYYNGYVDHMDSYYRANGQSVRSPPRINHLMDLQFIEGFHLDNCGINGNNIILII